MDLCYQTTEKGTCIYIYSMFPKNHQIQLVFAENCGMFNLPVYIMGEVFVKFL